MAKEAVVVKEIFASKARMSPDLVSTNGLISASEASHCTKA